MAKYTIADTAAGMARARTILIAIAITVGTAEATRIEADFTGTDCQLATFTGRVVLTKG
jgi:hypothetical protein